MISQANFDERVKAFILAMIALGRNSTERNHMGVRPTQYLEIHVAVTDQKLVLAGIKMNPGTERAWVINHRTQGDFTANWLYRPASEKQPEWIMFWFTGEDARRYVTFIQDATKLAREAGFGVWVNQLREDLRAQAAGQIDEITTAREDSPLWPVNRALFAIGAFHFSIPMQVDRLILALKPTYKTAIELIQEGHYEDAAEAILL